MDKTYKICLNGYVQGVGFRPFVYRIARTQRLKGTVSNSSAGVLIYVNTEKSKANAFLRSILEEKPKPSIVVSYSIEQVSFRAFPDFQILLSDTQSQTNTPLTPDLAICKSCKQDVLDPNNRRFNYAFTSCTECGPRYAIARQYPFERHHTSLSVFPMCSLCANEYTSPHDRRFHAQTTGCQICGIQLKLEYASKKVKITQKEQIGKKLADLIKQGCIIAAQGISGYLLLCDAEKPHLIAELRKRKKRPHKPFALLYPSIELIKCDFHISEYEKNMLESAVAPIVILEKNKNKAFCEHIAPNINQLGVMLPSSALLHLVMAELQQAVIATSGNSYGSPIISKPEEAVQNLKGIADCFLHHNLNIVFAQDDSVMRFAADRKIIFRRSRGLAPSHINIRVSSEKIPLAMGSDLKSTFTYLPNAHVYTSQYFGDLVNFDVFERYKTTLEYYFKLFNKHPQVILTDENEYYQSSIFGEQLAQRYDIPSVKVQHHKAHFASVLGEHQLFGDEGKILGVIWDGMGLGEDGNIWGGEFLMYQSGRMLRHMHFEYYDWIARDKMSKETRLSLLALLPSHLREHIRFKFNQLEWNNYQKLLQKNTLKTSSVGRLFDALAALLNLTDFNTFEGESGLLIENLAMTYKKTDYVDFLCEQYETVIPSRLLIQRAFEAWKFGYSKEKIAASFIFTLANCVVKIAEREQVNTVVCSGGVFQNTVLMYMLSNLLKQKNILFKTNSTMPLNDENISLGQLMYYLYVKKEA